MKNIKYTQTQYNALLRTKNLVAIDPYQGMNTKIQHLCLACNNIWITRPGVIRDNKECRHCYNLRVRKPITEVVRQLSEIGWSLVNDDEYKNSYSRLQLIHKCGNVISCSLDQVLNKSRRCLRCSPRILKNIWSSPVTVDNRKYYSKIERDCCEYLISVYGVNDVILHKAYSVGSRKECDAYIKSKDLYIEISTINKPWYLERIYIKRKLVKNFLFVSSLAQLKLVS